MKIFPNGILKIAQQTVTIPGEENNVSGLPWKVEDDDGTIYEFDETDREKMEDLVWEFSQSEGGFTVYHNGIKQDVVYKLEFKDETPSQPATLPVA